MTNKQMVKHLIEKLNRKIIYEGVNQIEIENPSGESIVFEFNDFNEITDIYS